MDYEVEIKFRRHVHDGLEARITHWEGVLSAAAEQQDAYFAHPLRDFSQTDEAFRIRSEGDQNWLTYKGPKIDDQTKTRREVEVSIAAGGDGRRRMTEMLAALGFRELLTVVKSRRSCRFVWEDREIKLVLDEVHGLGEFVELETIAPETDWQTARDSLMRFSKVLRMGATERRSYLELLMAQDREADED